MIMGLITSACGKSSDDPAWPRQGFRFSHKQSMQVEEDPEQPLDI